MVSYEYLFAESAYDSGLQLTEVLRQSRARFQLLTFILPLTPTLLQHPRVCYMGYPPYLSKSNVLDTRASK